MLRLVQALIVFAIAALSADAGLATPARYSSASPRLRDAVDAGRAPRSDHHHVLVGLELRNREALETFLADVQDPTSPRYQQFLTQDEFNALYAPTPDQEEAIVRHLRAAGVKIATRARNRLLVEGVGSVAALERAFGVEIHHVLLGEKKHYAALGEPSLPAGIAGQVVGVIGLDDLSEVRAHVQAAQPAVAPSAALGSNCCHLSPNDLFTLYHNSSSFPGTGQTIVIAGAYAWKDSDNTTFSTQWGLPQLPAGSGQVCTGGPGSSGCNFSNQNSIEIALDVEYAHGTAPNARILNYMSASTALTDFTATYNRIVTDNPGHVVTTSWGACEALMASGTQHTDDNIFANANAIGQSWFAASGDNGSKDCNSTVTVDNPANSPHVIGVGGTTPTCSAPMTSSSPGCSGYGSESAWSGSGGGVSQVFLRPAFQTGCNVPAGNQRLVPDVALESDTSPGNYVIENGGWYIVGGTSGAAPQWAGLFAELDQRRGGTGLGNPGAFLYGLCGTAALHDVTSGSNGDYSAGVGYDRVTGLGSFDATNLLAAAGSTTTTTSTTVAPTTTTVAPTTTTTHAPTTTTSSTTTTTAAATTSTTTTATTSVPTTTTTTTAPPTSTTTTTTSVPTTTTASTTSTTSSTTSTTLGGPCAPSGATCSQSTDCCSGTCRGKPGQRTCK